MEFKVFLVGFRLICIAVFVSASFVLTWHGCLAVVLFLASIFITRQERNTDDRKHGIRNPFKQNIRQGISLTEDTKRRIDSEITNFVVYDAENVESLTRFDAIKYSSECIFASKARIWGSSSWLFDLSLEENIHRILPTFLLFVLSCPELGLDGFLVELPEAFSHNLQVFADNVRRVLKVISDEDPSGNHCMNKSYIGGQGWVFEFNKMTFFVTTFAPFYPETHSRHSFGCRENGYILLQPELSFARKDLPTNTTTTNWDKPQTIRDRIRVAFRDAGRPYSTHEVPMVEEIVRPVDSNNQVKWWVRP